MTIQRSTYLIFAAACVFGVASQLSPNAWPLWKEFAVSGAGIALLVAAGISWYRESSGARNRDTSCRPP